MNIEQSIINRIEETRKTRKDACKNYANKEAAEKATLKAAQNVADEFVIDRSKPATPARYLVIFVPSWGRWVGAIELSEVLRRPGYSGGYLGVELGFYKF